MNDKERMLALLSDINEDIDFEHESALIGDGVLDSLDITVIIAAMDEAFGVHITTADIEPENFDNIDAMLRLIDRARKTL